MPRRFVALSVFVLAGAAAAARQEPLPAPSPPAAVPDLGRHLLPLMRALGRRRQAKQ